MNLFVTFLHIVGLYGAYLAGSIQLRTRSAEHTREPSHAARQLPQATLLMLLAVAVPTTLQFFFPSVLTLFERDYMRFLAGDWWRLITPLFVQDGGISGSIFNLVSLLLVGSAAEQLWGSRRWLIIWFIGGVLSEIIAFAWQPVGAGNSVANFSLAASVAVLCLTRNPLRPARIAALLALGAGMSLLLLNDIHGAAAMLGAVIAIVLIWFDRRWLLKRL
jgi:membrane associated rhomboid family serine protease